METSSESSVSPINGIRYLQSAREKIFSLLLIIEIGNIIYTTYKIRAVAVYILDK